MIAPVLQLWHSRVSHPSGGPREGGPRNAPGIEDVRGRGTRGQLLRFHLSNRLRRHEARYRAYPACRAHIPGFAAMWAQTEEELRRERSDADVREPAQGETVVTRPSGNSFASKPHSGGPRRVRAGRRAQRTSGQPGGW